MRVALLTAVMHDSRHLDAGTVLEVDADVGESWIARGLASLEVDAPPSPPPVKRDPFAVAALAEHAAIAPSSVPSTLPAPPEPDVSTDEPAIDDAPAPSRRGRRR